VDRWRALDERVDEIVLTPRLILVVGEYVYMKFSDEMIPAFHVEVPPENHNVVGGVGFLRA
jgi:hypothetical protein